MYILKVTTSKEMIYAFLEACRRCERRGWDFPGDIIKLQKNSYEYDSAYLLCLPKRQAWERWRALL